MHASLTAIRSTLKSILLVDMLIQQYDPLKPKILFQDKFLELLRCNYHHQ